MNNKIIIDESFDSIGKYGTVFQIEPTIFGDQRGFFYEAFRDGQNERQTIPEILKEGLSWIRQINRSSSSSFVIRGMHAQIGQSCQAKLVEAVNRDIYDIIVDARPDSNTFGTTKVFLLSSKRQNKLFVPRGFLHGFVVPSSTTGDGNAYFSYYCDNIYDKSSEIGVSPKSFLPGIMENGNAIFKMDGELNGFSELLEHLEKLVFSEKDLNGLDYFDFMQTVNILYNNYGKRWYVDASRSDLDL